MFGYAQDEIGDGLEEWTSRVHPDDHPQAITDAHRYDQDETPEYAKEYRMRCKDGSYKWVQERGKLMSRAKDGNRFASLAPIRTSPNTNNWHGG